MGRYTFRRIDLHISDKRAVLLFKREYLSMDWTLCLCIEARPCRVDQFFGYVFSWRRRCRFLIPLLGLMRYPGHIIWPCRVELDWVFVMKSAADGLRNGSWHSYRSNSQRRILIIASIRCIWSRRSSNLVNIDSNDIWIVHVALQGITFSKKRRPRVRFFFLFLSLCGQICYRGDASDFKGLGGVWRQVIHIKLPCLKKSAFMVKGKVYRLLGIVFNFGPLPYRTPSQLFSFFFIILLSFDLIPLLFSLFNDPAKLFEIWVD